MSEIVYVCRLSKWRSQKWCHQTSEKTEADLQRLQWRGKPDTWQRHVRGCWQRRSGCRSRPGQGAGSSTAMTNQRQQCCWQYCLSQLRSALQCLSYLSKAFTRASLAIKISLGGLSFNVSIVYLACMVVEFDFKIGKFLPKIDSHICPEKNDNTYKALWSISPGRVCVPLKLFASL